MKKEIRILIDYQIFTIQRYRAFQEYILRAI